MAVILIDENIPLLGETLVNCGDIYQFSGRKLCNADLIQSDCEFLFVRSTTKVNRQLLANTKVKYVATATSGIDHIDVDYLRKNNIVFASASGSNSNSVAEYLVFCLLKWAFETRVTLQGQSIGVIGYGNIGKKVAEYSKLLGLEVYVNDPPLRDEGFVFPDFVRYVELEDIFKECGIITNHVPLTSRGKYATKGMINKDLLSLVKEGALFFHLSRGGVVVEEDLLSVADEKNLYLVIDVWENEPNINEALLRRANFATPHIAGYSYDGKLRGSYMVAKHFCEYFNMDCDFHLLEKELSWYKPLPKGMYASYNLLYNLLFYSRKLENDNQACKGLLVWEKKERAFFFDFLRKSYPMHREIL